MIFYSNYRGLKNIHQRVKEKIIKKHENIFRYLFSSLFWLYIINFIILVFDATIINRLIFSLDFILVLAIINLFPIALFMCLIFPVESLSILIKKIKPLKRLKDRAHKKLDWGQKFSKRFSSASRLRSSTILIYSVILLSFSFDIIIDKNSYWWVAIILAVIIIIYLLFALINIFKAQKDIIYLSDRLETSGDFINSIKNNNIFNISKHLILGFIKSYSNPSDTNLSFIDKAINWAKKISIKFSLFQKWGWQYFVRYLRLNLS